MRECDIEAVRQLFPILQVIDVLNKLGVVKVAMLSEICDAERAPMGRQKGLRAGRAWRAACAHSANTLGWRAPAQTRAPSQIAGAQGQVGRPCLRRRKHAEYVLRAHSGLLGRRVRCDTCGRGARGQRQRASKARASKPGTTRMLHLHTPVPIMISGYRHRCR